MDAGASPKADDLAGPGAPSSRKETPTQDRAFSTWVPSMFLPQWRGRAGTTAAALLFVLSLCPSAPAQLPPPAGKGIGSNANNPPVIISLDATQVAGRKFRIFGRVADETPGNCGVVIS